MPRNAPKMHSERSKCPSRAAVTEQGLSGTYPRLNAVQMTLETARFELSLPPCVCLIIMNDDSCNQGGPTPWHQNHVVFPYPKMEPRKGLCPMVGRHWVPCVGQGSSRNGLAGQGPVVDICAEASAPGSRFGPMACGEQLTLKCVEA